MSTSIPQQRSLSDAARGDIPSAPAATDRSLPAFPQHPAPAAANAHTPFEREIERSQRASAALAATRALARASFTDSQLAAEGENAEGDIDTSSWIRTEYASLDHSVRAPQDGVPHGGAPRNLVGAGFNPGIAFQDARTFPGPSIGQAPIKTRGGAQARFLQESRQAPRPERSPAAVPRHEHSLSSGAGLYDKPAVIPMLATPGAAPMARPAGAGVTRAAGAPAPAGEWVKFALAVGVGAVVALIGGGVAWKAGWLAHGGHAALITNDVAAKAEAARLLSSTPPEIALPAPAAGPTSTRSNQEVDEALAAAARAAAVPVASVHAAGPSRVARPQPLPAPAAATAAPQKTALAVAPAAVARAPAAATASRGKDGVAAAIANAQARADSFLASGTAPAGAAEAAPELKKAE